jgi:hypothetical protein
MLVDHSDLRRCRLREAAHHLGGVGRVRDQEDVVVGVQVGDDVVDRATGRFVAADGILRLPRLDLAEVVAETGVDELGRARPGDPRLSQVRHVEHAHRLAHRRVLPEHPATRIFQGHVPTTERGKLGPERRMPVVQRGTTQLSRVAGAGSRGGRGGGDARVGHGSQPIVTSQSIASAGHNSRRPPQTDRQQTS